MWAHTLIIFDSLARLRVPKDPKHWDKNADGAVAMFFLKRPDSGR